MTKASAAQASTASFFNNKRKCVRLTSIALLENASGDKRIKLPFTINLTGESTVGMPSFVSDMFSSVAKEGSPINKSWSAIKLEGTTIAFFATDKAARKQLSLSNATLKSFVMSTKKARGKDLDDVVMSFVVYVSASKELWDWGYEMQSHETYAEFQPTQMSFGESKKEDDDEEEDGEEAEG